MKLVIIEPLGVEKEKLLTMAKDALGDRVEIVYHDTRVTDTDELIARGRDADIIAVSNLPLNEQVIRGCANLKMLAVAFTGVDHIAMDACREKGVTVCNCAGYSTAAVADLVFGMLICLYRNVIPCDERCRQGGTKDGLIGFELVRQEVRRGWVPGQSAFRWPALQTPSAARFWLTAARSRTWRV